MTCQGFMPNSFISPKPQQVQSIKQHSRNGNNRQLQPLPYLEASHGESFSRVEMGARRLIWGRIGWFYEHVAFSLSLPLLLSLLLQPRSSLPALAWEIGMSKAAIPLHLGGVHSESSAQSWTIWLRTKRIRKLSEFLCACSSRSVSSLSSCSVEALSLTKPCSLCISEPLHKHKPLHFLLD